MRTLLVDRDSSVGTATRYGLDGPGFKSRWGAEKKEESYTSTPPLGVHRLLRVSFTFVNMPVTEIYG
jgi:hypothetical protein